ncbi:MAG: hypothetical protein WC141_09255 [Arcobacteraceae bacterium]
MKTLIKISLFATIILFSGCAKNEIITPQVPTENEKNKIFKSKVLAKIIPLENKISTPYVKESKYIKILILPFENSENDIDYGGMLETKLEDSKFIFNDNLKNKIIEDTNLIGGI